jgi:uncharacterized protein YfaP (DUF2135 family)
VKNIRTMAGGIAAAAVMTMSGFGYAAAQPGDFSTLPVDPNLITDSLAYNAAPAVFNPNGQPGVETVYTHRDGSRTATAALNGAAAGLVANGKSQPAAVGSDGTMVTGMSPDGSKSVTVLSFAEGNTATTIEFAGAPKDPAPSDLVLELGRKQDTAIRDWLAA